MNKGTARILKNITQFPGKAVAEAGHNLGIAAKPVEKTTTREYMDLIRDIYFVPGAIEQIDNTLNGRKDRKGPLSKVQREMVMKNPTISTLVKKLCIERAVSEVTESISNDFFDGVNLSGKIIGKDISDYKDFLALRDKAFKDVFRKRSTFGEFTSQFDELMNVSIGYSKNMLGKVDKVMQEIAKMPNWDNQRAKAAKKIDQPTIAIMERMNGSDVHVAQAADFIDFMEGNAKVGSLLGGPYTFKELARMAATQDSKKCVREMFKLQDERRRVESSDVHCPDKVTDDENKRISEAKKNSDDQMKGVTKKRNDDMKSGRITSFGEYAESIIDLAKDEREARSLYSETVLSVNNAVANREYVQSIKDRLDREQKAQEDWEKNLRELENLGKQYGGMLHVEEIMGDFVKVKEVLDSSDGAAKEGDGASKDDSGDER